MNKRFEKNHRGSLAGDESITDFVEGKKKLEDVSLYFPLFWFQSLVIFIYLLSNSSNHIKDAS